jgi:uncharacterized protein YbjT (DUF2867 family)
MILVVGASGLLGTQICRELTQAGKPIRALVRKSIDPEKQKHCKAWVPSSSTEISKTAPP